MVRAATKGRAADAPSPGTIFFVVRWGRIAVGGWSYERNVGGTLFWCGGRRAAGTVVRRQCLFPKQSPWPDRAFGRCRRCAGVEDTFGPKMAGADRSGHERTDHLRSHGHAGNAGRGQRPGRNRRSSGFGNPIDAGFTSALHVKNATGFRPDGAGKRGAQRWISPRAPGGFQDKPPAQDGPAPRNPAHGGCAAAALRILFQRYLVNLS